MSFHYLFVHMQKCLLINKKPGCRSKEDVNMEVQWKLVLIKEEKARERNSQLMPLTTERATSLAASSYTCLVEQSDLNTLSIAKRKSKSNQKRKANSIIAYASDRMKGNYDLDRIGSLVKQNQWTIFNFMC